MANKNTKALSSAGIIGMMLSIMEVVSATPWSFEVSHQNFDADTDSIEYATVSSVPAMRRWIGGRDSKQLFVQSITLVSEPYEDTIFDKVKNWMWDRTGLLARRLNTFIGRSVTHWDKLATDALLAGETALTYDGAAFFSASHSDGSSGTIKNLVTNSDIAELDVANTAKVTTAEAADIIYALVDHFQSFKDDSGEPIHEGLNRVMIMVPTKMGKAFRQAIAANTITDTNGSRDNPLANSGMDIMVKINPRLTSTTVLYAFALNGDPTIILQQRGDVKLTAKAEGSDYEHDTDQWEFGMSAERTAGLFSWQSCIKATIS